MVGLRFIAGPMQGQVVGPLVDEVTLGRDGTNSIWLQGDPGVSRRHARIFTSGALFLVADLGSAAGTWVNGNRIGVTVPLQPGDLIQIAGHQFQFDDAVAPTASSAPLVPARPLAFPPEESNLTSLWVFIGLLPVASIGLSILGLIAIWLMQAALVVGGLFFFTAGWMEYRRYSPDPRLYEIATKAIIKWVAGGGFVVLGLLWIGAIAFGHPQEEPTPPAKATIQRK